METFSLQTSSSLKINAGYLSLNRVPREEARKSKKFSNKSSSRANYANGRIRIQRVGYCFDQTTPETRRIENRTVASESSILILDAGHLSLNRVDIRVETRERSERQKKKRRKSSRRKKGKPKKLGVENAVSERRRKRSSAAVAQFYRIRLFMRNIHRLKGARTLKGVFTLPWR